MPIKSIKLESIPRRAVLPVAAMFCFVLMFFAAKWCFANTLVTQTVQIEVVKMATELAPNDPLTHFVMAALNERTFLAENQEISLAEYEKAVSVSPNDFRLWLAVGRARERNGDAAGAEKALRKALELAPNYAQVQWTLGNLLLRQENSQEGFAFMRRAIETDKQYILPAVSTAWFIFDGDIAQIEQNIGNSANTKAALAVFLARQKRFDEAVQIWNALPENERQTDFKENGEEIYRQLIAEKQFRNALDFQTHSGETETFAVGKIANSSFENDIKTVNPSIFDWQIAEGLHPQIGLDNQQRQSGERSLVIIFNSSDGKAFRPVSQTVVVESGRTYEFEAFYKSELKTSTTLKWEIADAADGKILASTEPIAENSGWSNLRTKFSVPENTQAVVIRLARIGCISAICPISGKVWFDDLAIK
ncbi:MAG TPA: tetratricopeptide repeat protein [Pyrinomonadaceae bacterium]|nr:tetratricopeptide repeat protein [Pyrinomonadaceae bacterium]